MECDESLKKITTQQNTLPEQDVATTSSARAFTAKASKARGHWVISGNGDSIRYMKEPS